VHSCVIQLCQVVSSCVKLCLVVSRWSSCFKLCQVVSSCVKLCLVASRWSSCVKLQQVASSVKFCQSVSPLKYIWVMYLNHRSLQKHFLFVQLGHERSAVAQLLTRLSFGFSLGVGVLKNIFIPHPKREAKRESHSYENLTWLLVRGRGIQKKIFYTLPQTRISFIQESQGAAGAVPYHTDRQVLFCLKENICHRCGRGCPVARKGKHPIILLLKGLTLTIF
jgi:hypothetical protein